ncbi:MAG TPA: AAA family ATPase [Pirellulaceae bacterium]|jgi:AAA lid domain-containing protein/ATPase family protein associated with various cellular activities (AAA)|nr:AAA family ATPase [Pirellulaceae bacterium]
MYPANFADLLGEFRQAIDECARLYRDAAEQAVLECPGQLGADPAKFRLTMADLHAGLLLKIYTSVAEADLRWNQPEQVFAQTVFEHVWGKSLFGDELRETVLHVSTSSAALKWYSLFRPFDRLPPLRERIPELETLVLRIANLVAKADGSVTPGETSALQSIRQELECTFRPLPLEKTNEPERPALDSGTYQQLQSLEPPKLVPIEDRPLGRQPAEPPPKKSQQQILDEALAELDGLIGLANIKNEVRTLSNFLRMQRERKAAGLPLTPVSLHLVFRGNPGTGKTTVARIVGHIYAAMGALKKGHLVETDRSGLVAEYAGQTAPKTNKKVDEALDGILFIDEAYSLVADAKEDPYGQEAVQALVKRIEDDRQKLAVIIAGYSEPMDALLECNPGLSSRFATQMTFPDYSPGELGRIFQVFCDKNHYQAPGATQAKLLLGLKYLFDQRDEHFGNARLVRNVFERAIRRLANRIAGIAPLTHELLTVLEPADIEMPDVPTSVWDTAGQEPHKVTIACPGCAAESKLAMEHLGRKAKCKKCGESFVAAWGEPL